MTQQVIIDKITEAAESVDWSVTISNNDDGSLDVNFNTDTKFGQDLNCWGTLKDNDYKLSPMKFETKRTILPDKSVLLTKIFSR